MNDEELQAILHRLHRNARTLSADLTDTGYPNPSGTNAGSGPTTAGPRSPCDDTLLQEIRDPYDQITATCVEIHAAHPDVCWYTPRNDKSHAPNELHSWIAWLQHPRHLPLVLALDWAEDFIDILRDLDTNLDRLVNPVEPDAVRVSDWPTVAELASVAGCSTAAMHKRIQRAGIKPTTTIAGESVYERTVVNQII